VAGVGLLAGGLKLAYDRSEKFRAVVDATAGFLREKLWPALKLVAGFIRDRVLPVVVQIVTTFVRVQLGVARAVASIVGFVLSIPGRIGATVARLWNGVTLGITAARNWVGARLSDIVTYVGSLPGRVAAAGAQIWSGLRAGVVSARNWVRDRLSDVVGFAAALPGRMAGVFRGAFDGLKEAFRGAINWVIGKWNGLSFTLPGFDTGIPGVPSFGGVTISTPNIPYLAQGGVVDRPTLAVIGDGTGADRREIVTPESLMRSVFAAELERSQGATTINVTVTAATSDGRLIGSQIVEALRAEIRRSGPLPLRVAG
jgi:hypothetical protein